MACTQPQPPNRSEKKNREEDDDFRGGVAAGAWVHRGEGGRGRRKVKGSRKRNRPAPSRRLRLLPPRLPRTFPFPSLPPSFNYGAASCSCNPAERPALTPSLSGHHPPEGVSLNWLRAPYRSETGAPPPLLPAETASRFPAFFFCGHICNQVRKKMGSCLGKGAEQAVQGDHDVHSVKVFSYNELRKATQDFSGANKIGEGGFGSVFRGVLKDGTVVAVKVLSATSRQGIREFLTELTAISDIKHENLVTLIGCCAEGSHRILIYNYLENNSLAQTLLGSRYSNIRFNWRSRVKIAVGVARGLAFLHEEIRPPIIHRDIKASNILLDKDLTPKISDFGLARLLPPNATHVSTRVAGTLGYLAPEYAIRGQVTKKSDIYSYGVLLLEIVSGRCNTNTRLPSEDQFLLERTWGLYEEGRLEEIIDIDIGDDLDVDEACNFMKIGLLCTQDAMARRPNMTNVVRMLTGEKRINVDKITRPAMITDFADLKISNKEPRSSETRSPTTAPTTKSFTTTEAFSSSEAHTQSSM